MKYFVYILKMQNNTLYCGVTNDLEKRLKAHREGTGAKFTRAFKVESLVYSKEYESRSEAQKEEYRIKQLSKKEKLELIEKS